MENLLQEDIVKSEELVYYDVFEKVEPKFEHYVDESKECIDRDGLFSEPVDRSIAVSSQSEEIHLDIITIKKEEPDNSFEFVSLTGPDEVSYLPVDHSIKNEQVLNSVSTSKNKEKYLKFCSACNYSTSFRKDLQAHMKRTHEPRCVKIFCKYCGFYTDKQINLTSHIRNCHKPSDVYKLFCYYCKFTSESKQSLRSHIKQVHLTRFTEQRCLCSICGFSTRFPANLERHKKNKHLRHLSTDVHFECNECSYRCLNVFDMKNHRMKHQNKWRYRCFLCDYGSYRKYHLWRHTCNQHSNSPKGSFKALKKCYYCQYTTDVKNNFIQHFFNNHYTMYGNRTKYEGKGKIDELFYCGLCSYSAKSNRTVILHIDVVHKNFRLFPCHLCDYSTSYKSCLRVHITSKHYNIYPYKCDSCKYASSYKKHLRRHIITQHINKKPRKNARKKKLNE